MIPILAIHHTHLTLNLNIHEMMITIESKPIFNFRCSFQKYFKPLPCIVWITITIKCCYFLYQFGQLDFLAILCLLDYPFTYSTVFLGLGQRALLHGERVSHVGLLWLGVLLLYVGFFLQFLFQSHFQTLFCLCFAFLHVHQVLSKFVFYQFFTHRLLTFILQSTLSLPFPLLFVFRLRICKKSICCDCFCEIISLLQIVLYSQIDWAHNRHNQLVYVFNCINLQLLSSRKPIDRLLQMRSIFCNTSEIAQLIQLIASSKQPWNSFIQGVILYDFWVAIFSKNISLIKYLLLTIFTIKEGKQYK